MRTLQQILLATDFRTASIEAAQVAAQMAHTFGSHITLLHVEPPMPEWSVGRQELKEHVARALRQLAEHLEQQKVKVMELPLAGGSPADLIVGTAHHMDADLILIGAGERSELDRFALGPVAAAVMQHATQPVLAIRPAPTQATFQRILCPVDHSDSSLRGLENAIRLAKAFEGQLTVLSVVPPVSHFKSAWVVPSVWSVVGGGPTTLEIATEAHEAKWREEFDDFLKQVNFGDVTWCKEVRSGIPHEEIVAAAEEHQANLLVMGSTGRTGLLRLLMGSVTRRVIQHLPCSLLTVKRDDLLNDDSDQNIQRINALVAEGQNLLARGSFRLAQARFNQVLVENSYHIPALEGVAVACEAIGQFKRAERCRRRVATLRQESP